MRGMSSEKVLFKSGICLLYSPIHACTYIAVSSNLRSNPAHKSQFFEAYDNDNASVSVVLFPECPRFHWKRIAAPTLITAADRGCRIQPAAASFFYNYEYL